mmetsp:Transcript_1118/g.2047  ORF Transcript_1118/g.2047 Transcript_1118/m.2047 type:complete len:231 (+) Transcript_1118:7892-8584(+)
MLASGGLLIAIVCIPEHGERDEARKVWRTCAHQATPVLFDNFGWYYDLAKPTRHPELPLEATSKHTHDGIAYQPPSQGWPDVAHGKLVIVFILHHRPTEVEPIRADFYLNYTTSPGGSGAKQLRGVQVDGLHHTLPKLALQRSAVLEPVALNKYLGATIYYSPTRAKVVHLNLPLIYVRNITPAPGRPIIATHVEPNRPSIEQIEGRWRSTLNLIVAEGKRPDLNSAEPA